ncbi:polysaccharide deacetylase family protein [Actinoplanes sp. NPDC049599]|uniref:polysaccharide deacetylase family protein n=1 Tax=Actinoplanes sp. NPDC049599 TaxID=3363903 RepID=UPI00379799C5
MSSTTDLRQPRHRASAAGVLAALLRKATTLLAVCALGVAVLAWIDLSRPFDPPQLEPVQVPAAGIAAGVPSYPGAVTVLAYHTVSDKDPSTKTVTRRTFAEHMATLSALGYQTVSLATVRDLVRHKPVQLPERPLLLTFDDGSLTTWTTIDPVLAQHRFSAVAFLATDLVVEPGTPSYFLSTRQVRQLQETGRWEFGSHTAAMDRLVPVPGDVRAPLTNRILTSRGAEDIAQWRSRVAGDLTRSQQSLREMTGGSAIAFSYPFGDAGHGSNVPPVATELPTLIARAGFDMAFVGENVPTGHVDAVTESSPRMVLPRIGIRRTTSVTQLLKMIRESMPTRMPARLADLRWTGDAAACTTTAATVTVRAGSRRYGTCSVHDVNTSRWINYSLSTSIKGISPRSTAVIGLRDGAGAGHYGRVEVTFGMTRMVIRQRVGSAPLEELRTVALPSRAKTAVTIDVRGDSVTVRVTGRPPATATFDRRLHEGGITLAQIGTGTVTFQNATLTNHSSP